MHNCGDYVPSFGEMTMLSPPFHVGLGESVRLNLPQSAMIADCQTPRLRSLEDMAAAVGAALSDPLGFPPLPEAVVPGDRAVLAVNDGVPQAATIVASIIQNLVDAAATPQSITIVRPQRSDRPGDPLAWQLPEKVRGVVKEVTHDPADRSMLTYLAASRDGEPIYMNRAICDADLLVCVGCIRPGTPLSYLGATAGPFPTFAGDAARRRFCAPRLSRSRAQRTLRQREAEEAAWLLGSPFAVQVIPGTGDRVLHVLAGDMKAVARRGRHLAKTAWTCTVSRRADLVIAAIEGGPDQQTWENVARSLSAALRIVQEDGAVVVCSDLASPPGPSLNRVAVTDTLEEAQRQINRDRTADALAAWQLVQTMRRVKVYLLSRLEADVVEPLGIGHVSQLQEIERLSQRHHSCILLANSQNAIPSLQEELVSP